MESAAIPAAGTGSGTPLPPRYPRLVSGIDRDSGFASDFLNQFNEVVMLLDCVSAEDAFAVDELLDWQPRGYAAHFAAGRLAERLHIVRSYRLAPRGERRRLDSLAGELAALVTAGAAFIAACRRAGAHASIAPLARHLASDVRRRLATLDSLVHAGARRPSAAEVSMLFARRAA